MLKNCQQCGVQDRLKFHDAHRLREGKCAKCDKKIQTVYEPEDNPTVFCDNCYLKSIF